MDDLEKNDGPENERENRMRKVYIKVVLVLIIVSILGYSSQALTLTDDPSTTVSLSMIAAQWCKHQEMSYWEAFWFVTMWSVAKEVADQSAGYSFNSGHIGLNLAGMTFSWFIFDF